jgi:hypothetical protein
MLPPVALIVFNRPDLVKKQIENLQRTAIKQLFIIADGPRAINDDDKRCREVRQIIDNVNWRCDVNKSYAESNMGCANRIVSGINWVFTMVDRAVILEDDCLAHPSMFEFCGELLERYRDQDKVMHICGTQPFKKYNFRHSYLFSQNISCWGWATWARAWSRNELKINISIEEENEILRRFLLGNPAAVEHWQKELGMTKRKELDSWDYPWQLSIWRHNGLSIFPMKNLISNIGFRNDSTHTKEGGSKWANISTDKMNFPLTHPPDIERDISFDKLFIREVFTNESSNKITNSIICWIRKAIKFFSKKCSYCKRHK